MQEPKLDFVHLESLLKLEYWDERRKNNWKEKIIFDKIPHLQMTNTNLDKII